MRTFTEWRVVSDLDRTLIRSPSDALEAGRAIRHLQNMGVATVLASSKTFAEMVRFYDEAGLAPSPFIFENGCGIGWPRETLPSALPSRVVSSVGDFSAVLLGSALDAAREILQRFRRDSARFTLLEEMDPSAFFRLTGLDSERGALAAQRLASIPLIWEDSEEHCTNLLTELSLKGLRLVSGGIFLHVSPAWDKDSALRQLLDWQNQPGPAPTILACGDNENDFPLLLNANASLLFSATRESPLYHRIICALKDHRGSGDPSHISRLQPIEGAGPKVWLAAVETALRSHCSAFPHE